MTNEIRPGIPLRINTTSYTQLGDTVSTTDKSVQKRSGHWEAVLIRELTIICSAGHNSNQWRNRSIVCLYWKVLNITGPNSTMLGKLTTEKSIVDKTPPWAT